MISRGWEGAQRTSWRYKSSETAWRMRELWSVILQHVSGYRLLDVWLNVFECLVRSHVVVPVCKQVQEFWKSFDCSLFIPDWEVVVKSPCSLFERTVPPFYVVSDSKRLLDLVQSEWFECVSLPQGVIHDHNWFPIYMIEELLLSRWLWEEKRLI